MLPLQLPLLQEPSEEDIANVMNVRQCWNWCVIGVCMHSCARDLCPYMLPRSRCVFAECMNLRMKTHIFLDDFSVCACVCVIVYMCSHSQICVREIGASKRTAGSL